MRPSGAVRRSLPICVWTCSARAINSGPTRGSIPSSAKSRLASRWAEQVDQFCAHRFEFVAEFSFLHRAGTSQGALRRCVEKIEQALRLREGKLVVEVGALGEFAGPGHSCTEFKARAQNIFHDVRIAVARDFHGVFTRVRIGRLPVGQHGIVENFVPIPKRTIDGRARHPGDRLQKLIDDLAALRPAQPDHRQCGHTRRCAQGDNRVGGHEAEYGVNGSPCASATA